MIYAVLSVHYLCAWNNNGPQVQFPFKHCSVSSIWYISWFWGIKTIFFSRKLCDFKIMQMAFCLQAVESAKRNCWQKKEGDILCLDDYAGVKSFKSPSAGFRHEKAFSIINSCGLLWSSMHTNVTPHVGFQDLTSFASIAMIENRASSK